MGNNKGVNMSEDTIWVNLVPNPNKTADNHPDWVAPPNTNAPEGKKWTIGVNVNGVWHNQAGWNNKDDQGNLEGITIKMTPNSASGSPKAAPSNKGFQSKPSYDNKESYKF